jgi:hypothetical protein
MKAAERSTMPIKRVQIPDPLYVLIVMYGAIISVIVFVVFGLAAVASELGDRLFESTQERLNALC